MNEKAIRNRLWKQVNREFEEFKKDQLNKDKEEIFDNAYKIAVFSDLVDMCDSSYGCLTINDVKALLKERYPVHTLYNYYMKSDVGGISDLYEAIWYRLDKLQEKNLRIAKQKNER